MHIQRRRTNKCAHGGRGDYRVVNEQWETGSPGIPEDLYLRIETVIAISIAWLLDSLLADGAGRR